MARAFTSFMGDRYEGSYVQGERTGEGIYYHADGNKYVGNFKNGMQDRHGTFTWANGAVYDGQWKDNQRNGYGVYKWNVGDSYKRRADQQAVSVSWQQDAKVANRT